MSGFNANWRNTVPQRNSLILMPPNRQEVVLPWPALGSAFPYTEIECGAFLSGRLLPCHPQCYFRTSDPAQRQRYKAVYYMLVVDEIDKPVTVEFDSDFTIYWTLVHGGIILKQGSDSSFNFTTTEELSGQFLIEVSSALPNTLGSFTLSVGCTPKPNYIYYPAMAQMGRFFNDANDLSVFYMEHWMYDILSRKAFGGLRLCSQYWIPPEVNPYPPVVLSTNDYEDGIPARISWSSNDYSWTWSFGGTRCSCDIQLAYEVLGPTALTDTYAGQITYWYKATVTIGGTVSGPYEGTNVYSRPWANASYESEDDLPLVSKLCYGAYYKTAITGDPFFPSFPIYNWPYAYEWYPYEGTDPWLYPTGPLQYAYSKAFLSTTVLRTEV